MLSALSTQHSALSTQHSALSTQHSALAKFILFLVIVSFGSIANAQLACKYAYPDNIDNLSQASYSTALAACQAYQTDILIPAYGIPGSIDHMPISFYERQIADGSYLVTAQGLCAINLRGSTSAWIFCKCPIGQRLNRNDNCDPAQSPTLTLTPAPNQKDPRPKGTEGKDPKSSTYELIAKVMEGSTPKAGVEVKFAVEPIANSGGHDHHDTSRPKGLVNGALTASGKTEANGEIKVTFQASEFAGTHVVAAACDSCTNKSVTKNVDVKVPGLIELQGDYSPSAKYELIGNENPPGTNHKGNHFFAPEAKDALRDLFPIFTQYNWGIVGVNDSSLKWGGRFDIAGQWNNGHKEHREGKEVDISFYRPFETIDEDKRDKVYEHLKKTKGVGLPQVLWHEKDNPATPSYAHFHVYLLGQSFFRKTTY